MLGAVFQHEFFDGEGLRVKFELFILIFLFEFSVELGKFIDLI